MKERIDLVIMIIGKALITLMGAWGITNLIATFGWLTPFYWEKKHPVKDYILLWGIYIAVWILIAILYIIFG